MAHHRSIIRRDERRRNRSKKTSRFHTDRPRLVVYRSLRHFEAQIIDDFKGATLVSVSSRDKELQSAVKKASNKKPCPCFQKERNKGGVFFKTTISFIICYRLSQKGAKQGRFFLLRAVFLLEIALVIFLCSFW